MDIFIKLIKGIGTGLFGLCRWLLHVIWTLSVHLCTALWFLIKWSVCGLFSGLYLLSRLLSLPFRMCFPVDNIDKMDGIDFENFAAKWLKYNSYRDIKVTPASSDYGVDVLARRDGVLYGVQCKRYSGNVGISAVQEISAGIAYYECDKGMIFTNSELTRSASNLAEANGIEVIDGELLKSTKAADLIIRSRASLVFSSVMMTLLLVLSAALTIWTLIHFPKFAPLPALLILLCTVSLVNARREITKRDENPENFDTELQTAEHEPF